MAPGILSLLVCIMTFTLPESPRWLVLKGDQDGARQSQARISDADPHGEEVVFTIAQVIKANDLSFESASFWSLFTMGREKMLYRLFLACSSQWYSQMGGSALITYYSTQLFRTIGLNTNLSRILGASVLTFKAVCCLIPFFTIERFGRRNLFMVAGGGMAVCMVSLNILVYDIGADQNSSAWPSLDHKSPPPILGQPTLELSSPSFSSLYIPLVSSASISSTVKKSSVLDTELQLQVSLSLPTG